MRARRTAWWQYVVALILGLLAGIGLMSIMERTALNLSGVPWIIPLLLLIVGIVVLILALQVRAYIKADRKDRKRLSPSKAVMTLLLAKSLGLASAALAGWYGGQLLMALPHAEASLYATTIRECVWAVIVCVVDMIIGIVSEGMCQLPPNEGPEHPDCRRREERQRSYAEGAAAKEGRLQAGGAVDKRSKGRRAQGH